VITSVHSFALDPARGVFILALIGLAVGGALLVYAIRGPRLSPGNGFAPVSREGGLVLNNLLFSAGMATVFLGTFYPLLAEIWSGVKLSVGPPYFNETFVPILGLAIVSMALGPMLAWRRGDLGGAVRRLAPALGGALLAPAAVLVFDPGAKPAALAGVALAVWAMLGVLADLADRTGFTRLPWATCWRRLSHLPRATWGQVLAHFGVGVLIAGITVSTAWRSERIETMHPGDTMTIAGRSLRLVGVAEGSEPNYAVERAEIVVDRPGGAPFALHPERRFFPLAQSTTARTAIATNGFADLYLALGDPDGHGGWVVRAYYNPLVPWIWFGAIIAVTGGLVSLSDRLRYRRVPAGATAAAMVRSAEPG
jgi:cytochrome c-type biogenesis protein CcmF